MRLQCAMPVTLLRKLALQAQASACQQKAILKSCMLQCYLSVYHLSLVPKPRHTA